MSDTATHTLRPIQITRAFTKHAEGSVLIAYGDTRVLCNASLSEGVPRFLKGSGKGWLTAEYSMLPRATAQRTDRESMRGKPSGRTLEIQRLIGRSLRAAVDLKALADYTLTIDCDVLQADGGTRTAAITGGCIALYDAIQAGMARKCFKRNPFKSWVAAVSVGLVQGIPHLDLDYEKDSNADTDMNVVMNESGAFIEIQGTAEKDPFTPEELTTLTALASQGIQTLITHQKEAIGG